ncbi:TIR domain-containing protein [Acidiferrobacter thiooxydans]|nr:TIR domain-containing protein [Acidiferrobacter thiooxydans]
MYLTDKTASSKWIDWEIAESLKRAKGVTSVRRLSVYAMGRPSRHRALDLGATHDLSAPLRDAAAVLRASRALFRRTRGSPTITGRRIDVLAGGLRPPARTYASRGLRALASLIWTPPSLQGDVDVMFNRVSAAVLYPAL